MKKLILLFALAAFVFACKTETKNHTEDHAVEDLQKAVEESNEADLANYEYVCNHCKLGSHEAGTCPCGMEFEKNANFVAPVDEEHM